MGPILSRHYVAVTPAAVREMTLREIAAYLAPLTSAERPSGRKSAAGLMAHHPRTQGGIGG